MFINRDSMAQVTDTVEVLALNHACNLKNSFPFSLCFNRQKLGFAVQPKQTFLTKTYFK